MQARKQRKRGETMSNMQQTERMLGGSSNCCADEWWMSLPERIFRIAVLVVLGVASSVTFWELLWHFVAGLRIPTVWGVSRLWLDTFALPFWLWIIKDYLVETEEKYEEIRSGGFAESNREFLRKHWRAVLVGCFLLSDITVGTYYFSALGSLLVCCVFLALCFAKKCLSKVTEEAGEFASSLCGE